jgi:hypothetical protein
MVVWHGSPRANIITSADKGNYQIARSDNQAADQRGKDAYHFLQLVGAYTDLRRD